jgi:hypothetical protein
MPDRVYKRSSEILEAAIGSELVTLDVKTGDCFGFNEVAATIWTALATPRTFEELKDQLVSEYDISAEECSAELGTLLEELVEKGLVATEQR